MLDITVLYSEVFQSYQFKDLLAFLSKTGKFRKQWRVAIYFEHSIWKLLQTLWALIHFYSECRPLRSERDSAIAEQQLLFSFDFFFLHIFFRELCTKLYSTSWGNSQSWQEFDRFCEYNAVEVSMLTCLADVREPCQLGCRNLTYCTNFNNR